MSNYPRPQWENSAVGFVYFPKTGTEPATSAGASGSSSDFIDFGTTPNPSAQPNNAQQFRKPKNYRPRGHRNNNRYFAQQPGDSDYQQQKPFHQNKNRGRANWRGNYQPRGDFNPHGDQNLQQPPPWATGFVQRGYYSNPRANFTPRGHRGAHSSRGNYQQRGQNRNRGAKRYNTDIRRYINHSMVEDPWADLMDNLKLSGLKICSVTVGKYSSDHPKPCTTSSADPADDKTPETGAPEAGPSESGPSVASPGEQKVSSAEE